MQQHRAKSITYEHQFNRVCEGKLHFRWMGGWLRKKNMLSPPPGWLFFFITFLRFTGLEIPLKKTIVQ